MDNYRILKIIKVGDSEGVAIPKEFKKELDLKAGKYLKGYIQDGKLIMEKIK